MNINKLTSRYEIIKKMGVVALALSSSFFWMIGCGGIGTSSFTPTSEPTLNNPGNVPGDINPGIPGTTHDTPPTPVFGELQLDVALSLLAQNDSAALTVAPAFLTLSSGVNIDEVRFNLRSVDLKPIHANLDAGKDYTGPFVVDLAQAGQPFQQTTPGFQKIQVAADQYQHIQFHVDPLAATEVPQGLESDNVVQSYLTGNTLVIEGSFVESPTNDIDGDGTVSQIPFRFMSDLAADVNLTIPTSFTVCNGCNQTASIFLALRLNDLFSSLLPGLQNLDSGNFQNGILLLDSRSSASDIRFVVEDIESGFVDGFKFAEASPTSSSVIFQESNVDEASFSEIDFSGLSLGNTTDFPASSVGDTTHDLILSEFRVAMDYFDVRSSSDVDTLHFQNDMAFASLITGSQSDQSLFYTSTLSSQKTINKVMTANGVINFTLAPLSLNQAPVGVAYDAVTNDLLDHNSIASIGFFREAAGKDIDGSGDQNFVRILFLSDSAFTFSGPISKGDDVKTVIFNNFLQQPDRWFSNTIPLLQNLDPSLYQGGQIILSRYSRSQAIRDIVKQIENNIDATALQPIILTLGGG